MARKEYKIHYIYKTTCIVTGKFYIGMHSTFNEDDGYLGSGKVLGYSIRKYGKEKHSKEIVEYCLDRSSLKVREKEIVNEELLNDKMCMNLKLGGEGGFPLHCAFGNIDKEIQSKRSQSGGNATSLKFKTDKEFAETKTRISSKNMKELHRLGKISPPNWTGKKHSRETIEKLKEKKTQVGTKNSQFGTCWITNGLENKKIKKTDIDRFINEGWKLGRVMYQEL